MKNMKSQEVSWLFRTNINLPFQFHCGNVYGETIYGSSKGPIPPNDSLVSTQKDGIVFLHLLDITDDKLEIKNFNGKVSSIKNFVNKDKISFRVTKNTLVIELQDQELDSISTVLVVETK